jgi:hypothetical protein
MPTYARLNKNNVVINIEQASLEWVNSQPDPSIFVEYTDENPATVGGDYVDGYFYGIQHKANFIRDKGKWIPPIPKPENQDEKYIWDDTINNWVTEEEYYQTRENQNNK